MSADQIDSMPPGSVSHVSTINWPTGIGPFPYLGPVAPDGWYMLKPGQGFTLEPIADWPDLFSLIGTRWGGDGITTFALPQAGLFTRGPDGTHALWTEIGEDTHTLTANELAAHSHSVGADDSGGGAEPFHPNNLGGSLTTHQATVFFSTDSGGGGNQPHNNVPKALVTNLIIKA